MHSNGIDYNWRGIIVVAIPRIIILCIHIDTTTRSSRYIIIYCIQIYNNKLLYNIVHLYNNIIYIIRCPHLGTWRYCARWMLWDDPGGFDFSVHTNKLDNVFTYVNMWYYNIYCIMGTYGHARVRGSPLGVVYVLYELKTIRFPWFRVITIMINYNITMGVTRIW